MDTTEERQKSLEFMEKADEWPQWPYLPVKLRGEAFTSRGSGVMLEADGFTSQAAPVVYLKNLWDDQSILEVEKLEFLDLQAVVDAG